MTPTPSGYPSTASYLLAADGRFNPIDRQNDHTWELSLTQQDFSPINLQTTFQLQARAMRLSPLLMVEQQRFTARQDYFQPPEIVAISPAVARIQCQPVEQAIVQYNCFVISGDTLVGDCSFHNQRSEPLALTMVLAVILSPMGNGSAARPEREGINQIITGKTGNLHPVLFLTGGPTAIQSPYPALSISMVLDPQQSRRLSWALVSKEDRSESLDHARRATALPWRQTAQRHFVQHEQDTLFIHSGHRAWDEAFLLSQRQAQVQWQPDAAYPTRGVFCSRLPDQPAAPPDAKEASLSLLDLHHLVQAMLPTHAPIVTQLLIDRLEAIATADDGSNKATNSDRKALVVPPLLAHLVLEVYAATDDVSLLTKAYPILAHYLESNFNCESDRIPTGLGVEQFQIYSGLFNFDIWEETGRGLDMNTVVSPALLAFCHQEWVALQQIAHILEKPEDARQFSHQAEVFLTRIQATWDEDRERFTYRDASTGLNPSRELHFPGRTQSDIIFQKTFIHPQRLQLQLIKADERPRCCQIELTGLDLRGQPSQEIFNARSIHWVRQRAHITSRHHYAALTSLSMKGLNAEDRFLIETMDLSPEDITCLLPIWSGAATSPQMDILSENVLLHADYPLGPPETWVVNQPLPKGLPIITNILWNTLLLEGLIRNNRYPAAVDLFERMMDAMTHGLQHYDGFFGGYTIPAGHPVGLRHALTGWVPTQQFLTLAGIRVYTPEKVAVWGRSPFSSPIEVHWRGLAIKRSGAHTSVRFSNGQTYQIDGEEPIIIRIDPDEENRS